MHELRFPDVDERARARYRRERAARLSARQPPLCRQRRVPHFADGCAYNLCAYALHAATGHATSPETSLRRARNFTVHFALSVCLQERAAGKCASPVSRFRPITPPLPARLWHRHDAIRHFDGQALIYWHHRGYRRCQRHCDGIARLRYRYSMRLAHFTAPRQPATKWMIYQPAALPPASGGYRDDATRLMMSR
jgi:hypothetical protein